MQILSVLAPVHKMSPAGTEGIDAFPRLRKCPKLQSEPISFAKPRFVQDVAITRNTVTVVEMNSHQMCGCGLPNRKEKKIQCVPERLDYLKDN